MPGSQLLSPVAHSRRWASRFGILAIRRLPGASGNSWTNTIKTLSTQAADVVVLCCITWPDWYDEEQERACGPETRVLELAPGETVEAPLEVIADGQGAEERTAGGVAHLAAFLVFYFSRIFEIFTQN